MKIESLGLKTNLILNSVTADILYKKDYIVIRTKSRLDHIWGNYIIMSSPPEKGGYDRFVDIFKKEIDINSQLNFIAITFDSTNVSSLSLDDFIRNDFRVFTSKILTAEKVIIPTKLNSQLRIKTFEEKDWEHYADIHYQDNWGYGGRNDQIKFLNEEAKVFKKMVCSW